MISSAKRTNPRLYPRKVEVPLTVAQKDALIRVAEEQGCSQAAWIRRQIEAARVRLARREKP
jgi:hypothetical protein